MSRHAEREKRRTALVWLLLLLALAAALIAGYMLLEGEREYAEGDEVYEALSERVRTLKAAPRESAAPQETAGAAAPQETAGAAAPQAAASAAAPQETASAAASTAAAQAPAVDIDWKELKEINKEASIWLYCPNTVIDYPVAIAKDYSYYLDHLIDGTPNKNGTLFLDYNCAPDLSDRLSIIYGHHMRSGRMFGTLVKYKKQSYFEKHPYMYLYTGRESYRIELLYGCVIGAGEWRDRAYMYPENVDALLEYAKANTTFESGAAYTDEDSFIALSTCSYEFDEARYVVIGVMKPEH